MDSRTRVLRRPMRTAGISPTASNLHALLREMHSRSANSATVMSFSFGGAFCIICSTPFPLARHVIAPRRECGPIVSRLGFVFQMATRKHEKTPMNRGFCCSTGNFWQLFGNFLATQRSYSLATRPLPDHAAGGDALEFLSRQIRLPHHLDQVLPAPSGLDAMKLQCPYSP